MKLHEIVQILSKIGIKTCPSTEGVKGDGERNQSPSPVYLLSGGASGAVSYPTAPTQRFLYLREEDQAREAKIIKDKGPLRCQSSNIAKRGKPAKGDKNN